MNILNILDDLASTNSQKVKQEILQKHKGNALLQRVFVQALNPFITYGIRKIPDYTPQTSPLMSLEEAMTALVDFETRKVTGNAAASRLFQLLTSLHADDAVVLERIIKRDLRCGVGSMVNKVWPKLIREFAVSKATPYDEKTILKIKFPAISQVKIDGGRCNVKIDSGEVTLYSAGGNVLEVHELFNWMGDLHPAPMVIDGELVAKDPVTGKTLDRKTGNGLVNKAIAGTISAAEARMLHFVAFDMITLDDWREGKMLVPQDYKTRFHSLRTLLKSPGSNVSLIEWREVNDETEALAHFKELYNKGEEGIILKDYRYVWDTKRSPLQLKFKGIVTCDLEVIGFEYGEKGTKYEKHIGALICASADRELVTNVGTGLKDPDRMRDPAWYTGKVVEIAYNERIRSKVAGSKWALFLPRFILVRDDKKAADTIDNIPEKGTK